jgi:hypothetical protein
VTDTLYTYRCKSCKTLAVASYRAKGHGDCVRCNVCRSPMPFLYAEPVTTTEQRAFWQRGLVYNPGAPERKPGLPTCDICGEFASMLYGVYLIGVGRFCSAKCADEGVEKHEAAMERPSADLMAKEMR